MALIEARDLTKTYTMGDQTVHALRGVSLDIEAGGFVGLGQKHAYEHFGLPGCAHLGPLPPGG